MAESQSAEQEVANRRLQQLIAANKVVVFCTSSCPYCFRAKAVLSSQHIPFAEHDIHAMRDGDAVFDAITKSTGGHDTVPAIYIGGKFVGGCSDLMQLSREGKLKPMVA